MNWCSYKRLNFAAVVKPAKLTAPQIEIFQHIQQKEVTAARTDIPEIVATCFFVRQHCYFRRELPLLPSDQSTPSISGTACLTR